MTPLHQVQELRKPVSAARSQDGGYSRVGDETRGGFGEGGNVVFLGPEQAEEQAEVSFTENSS